MKNLGGLLSLLLAGFTFSFQSCKTAGNIPVVQLSGEWVLQTFDGKAAGEVFKGDIPTIDFDITAKRISGTGGCNDYTGAFSLNKNEFSAPNLTATLKMCFAANQESAFFRLLANTSRLSLEGDKLIFTQDGKQVLAFARAKAVSAADLEGTWTLQAMQMQGALAMSPFEEKAPTIAFNFSENRVSGNAGCNNYNAPFTLEGNSLSVGMAAATRRACENMESEAKFLQLLSGAYDVKLSGNTLTLLKDGVIQLQFSK